MKKPSILNIYSSEKTVFSIKDVALIWGETNKNLVKKRIYRYVKGGKLYPIRKGFYAKNRKYDKFELATKIYSPSYISLETVLSRAGVIFQYYKKISVASYLSREVEVDGQKYSYRKIRNPILINSAGLENRGSHYIATPERAFLDTVYLDKEYYFDNLSAINWKKVFDILPIYSNKRMEKSVKEYYKKLKNKN